MSEIISWAEVMRVRVTFVVAATLAAVATAMLSQQALCEGLVVPQLTGVRHVPSVWWLGNE